jgi:D-glycero-D-manno-heptose 1,7-bisphosphate phosphatase
LAEDAHRVWIRPGAAGGGPALFVDRDGTLIEDPGYLADPAGVRLIPHAAEALQRFSTAGYALVLVTNQSGVGRGFFGWTAYDRVAETVRDRLAQAGVRLDAELVCGHAPDDGCDWRKPAPGMLREAISRLSLDPAGSVMVGDKLSDLEAAAGAGVGRLVHVATGQGAAERGVVEASPLAVETVDDLSRLAPCAS